MQPKSAVFRHFFHKKSRTFGTLAIKVRVECKSEGHIKYHPTHSTSVTELFKDQIWFQSGPFHGSFHVFKHSKADEMNLSIAEVNITSPKWNMCGHLLLCYCCLLFLQQPRCQIHLICRYCPESHYILELLELFAVSQIKGCFSTQFAASGTVDMVSADIPPCAGDTNSQR